MGGFVLKSIFLKDREEGELKLLCFSIDFNDGRNGLIFTLTLASQCLRGARKRTNDVIGD